jgi:hypothetical protein
MIIHVRCKLTTIKPWNCHSASAAAACPLKHSLQREVCTYIFVWMHTIMPKNLMPMSLVKCLA